MTTRRKLIIGVGAVLLTLTITNPSLREFKDFVVTQHYLEDCGRSSNFIIFSMYQGDVPGISYDGFIPVDGPPERELVTKRYIGIFKNFYEIGGS